MQEDDPSERVNVPNGQAKHAEAPIPDEYVLTLHDTFRAAPPVQYAPMGQVVTELPLQKEPGDAEQGGVDEGVAVWPEQQSGKRSISAYNAMGYARMGVQCYEIKNKRCLERWFWYV